MTKGTGSRSRKKPATKLAPKARVPRSATSDAPEVLEPSPEGDTEREGKDAGEESIQQISISTAEPEAVQTASPELQAKIRPIVLTAQDKGGIGKSHTALVIWDWYQSQKANVKSWDLDHANSTFKARTGAEFLYTDVQPSKLGPLDQIVESAKDHDAVLVDNRATGGSKLADYLHQCDAAGLQEELGFRLTFILIAIADKDAISQGLQLLRDFHTQVRWLLVRNLRDGEDLTMFDDSRLAQELKNMNVPEISMPALTDTTRDLLARENLTIRMGAQIESGLPAMDRNRCRLYTETMASELEKVRHLLLP